MRVIVGCLLALSIFGASAAAQESALEPLRTAARAAARDYDAQLAYGRALLEAGRFREASTQLRRAAQLRRNDPQALFEMARVAFEQRDYRAARTQCRAIARIAAGTPIARVCEARAFLAWNRSERAFEELNAALAQAPDDFEALLALGDAHRLRGSVADAEAAYRRAIEASGGRSEPHLGLGQLYAQAGRAAEAITALQRAHELAPNDPDVDLELGRLLTGDDALAHLREAVADRPTSALAHAALGEALLAAGQIEEARRELQTALQRDRNLVGARTALGRAQLAAGELAGAEQTLSQVLALVPNDPAAVMGLADVFARTDRLEEAYGGFRQAADLDPRNPEPLLRAARLALSQERPVLAQGFLVRGLTARPNDAATLALMGDVMRARNMTAEARSFYQRALRGEGPIDRAAVHQALRELR